MTNTDAFEMMQNFMKGIGLTLPAFMAPSLDTDKIEAKIKDLRSVESWLLLNLNMLQLTIQSLEMQHLTLTNIRRSAGILSENAGSASSAASPVNPFGTFMTHPATNPAMWPWLNPSISAPQNLAGAMKDAASAPQAEENATRDASAPDPRHPTQKRSGS